jgi:cytochrome c biogenesis protein CcmG, thiol:disulfide interchange protein DsbE
MPDSTDNDRPQDAPGQAEGLKGAQAKQSRLWFIVPVLIFAAVVGLFGYALTTGDPSKLPSALIGKPAPATEFVAVEGLTDAGRPVSGFSTEDLKNGEVSVVNFWASWCVPCVQEHAFLSALKEQTGVPIYGVNYKDQPVAARRFLGRFGNPFAAVGTDPRGRGAIEWGVYGMPETFVVNGKGEIVYKHVGPISQETLSSKVIPAIERARQKSAGS